MIMMRRVPRLAIATLFAMSGVPGASTGAPSVMATPSVTSVPAHISPTQEVALQPVPSPALDELEDSVAEQLREMRALLDTRLTEDGITTADLAETYGELGRIYHAYEIIGAAEACYLNAIALAPADYRHRHLLAHLYQISGDPEGAIRYYRESLRLQPLDDAAKIHLAEVLRTANRLDEAQALFLEAIETRPESAAVLAGLGQIALAKERFDLAVDFLERALAEAPSANRLHYPLGLAYRGLGDAGKARQHLSQRGMLGVRSPDPLIDTLADLLRGETIHLLRGRMAYRAGHLTDAADEFRSALEARPDSITAAINLSAVLVSLARTEEAIELLRGTISRAPTHANAHFNLGSILAHQGSYDEAIEHLESAVRLAPLDWLARLELAETLVDTEQFAAALGVLEQGHGLAPDAGLLAHPLARLLASSPDAGLRDGPRALELALRVFEARRTAEHAETVAMAYAETNQCSAAADWQRNVLEASAGTVSGERLAELGSMLAHYETTEPCRYPVRPAR